MTSPDTLSAIALAAALLAWIFLAPATEPAAADVPMGVELRRSDMAALAPDLRREAAPAGEPASSDIVAEPRRAVRIVYPGFHETR